MPDSVLYVVCFISAGLGAWLVSRFGENYGLIDNPGERSSHGIPVPKGGGIGILASFVLASTILEVPSGFWISAFILSLISLYGDKSELSPRFRMVVQFLAAVSFLISSRAFWQAPSHSLWLVTLWILCLLIFIVGTANFYNFMDGINGIAAITGIVAFGLLALYSITSHKDRLYVVLSICISLSCLGFLPFNIPKAKVFIGDAGSIFLGFVFAGMVILLAESFLDFACLASFLFPFYADELSTMAVRLKDGENLLRPHRRHLYQLLANEKGITHWKISAGFGLFQLIVGASALMLQPFGIIAVLSALAVCFMAFIAVTVIVRKNFSTIPDKLENV